MYEYAARLVRVVDGDTVILDIDKGFRDWRLGEPVRIYGVDTPELNSKDASERERARAAMAETERLIRESGEPLIVRTYKNRQDKYGRWLADILITPDGTALGSLLVRGGFAKPYFGGAR